VTVAIFAPLRNTSALEVAPDQDRFARLTPCCFVIVTLRAIVVPPEPLVVVTDFDVLPVAPALSVTVSVTVLVPADAYVLLTVAPLPDDPSPKFHEYPEIEPSGSDDADPLKEQVRSVQLYVNEAVGGWFTGPPPPPPMNAVYSSRFGDPVPALVTFPDVALPVRAEVTVEGEAPGLPCRYSAAAPATCGDAMDVPLIVFVEVLLVYQAEVIELPGAKMSRQFPKLEYEALASVLVVAPTVTADAARAGE